MFRKQAAELTGISTDTLRYYESLGLITPRRDGINGYRIYDEEIVQKINTIKYAKACGLSLAETKEVVDILFCTDVDYKRINERVKDKIDDVNLKISQLTKYKAILVAVKNNIDGGVECPLKNAFKGFL